MVFGRSSSVPKRKLKSHAEAGTRGGNTDRIVDDAVERREEVTAERVTGLALPRLPRLSGDHRTSGKDIDLHAVTISAQKHQLSRPDARLW